ncbi:MAG: hypothetical protein WC714_20100 [Candidatus Obscuribacterales bacterium]|jgi:hypothetical protein
MNQAVQSFLTKNTNDSAEQLAQRAIKALHELRRLAQNFADNGRTQFFANAKEGIKATLYGFCCLNTMKRFTFADQVDEQVRDFTAFVKETLASAGQALEEGTICALSEDAVQFAEGMVETHKVLYRPVAKVSGVSSVAILRGDFCRMAVAGLNPANEN